MKITGLDGEKEQAGRSSSQGNKKREEGRVSRVWVSKPSVEEMVSRSTCLLSREYVRVSLWMYREESRRDSKEQTKSRQDSYE